jgi:hypothetical protein
MIGSHARHLAALTVDLNRIEPTPGTALQLSCYGHGMMCAQSGHLGVRPARGPWTNLGRLPLRVFSIGKYAFQKKRASRSPEERQCCGTVTCQCQCPSRVRIECAAHHDSDAVRPAILRARTVTSAYDRLCRGCHRMARRLSKNCRHHVRSYVTTHE